MKEKILYAVWACLYILCVGFGTVENPEGARKVLLVLTAVIFFLPGALLVHHGISTGNKKVLLRLRITAITSLSLTAIALAANLLSVGASATAGQRLYELLVLVSAPMMCMQYWVVSLFLWACLLMASFTKIKTTN